MTCIDDIRRGPVLAEHLMQIVGASQGSASAGQPQIATQPWPPRPDAPVRRPAVRASLSAGLEATQPANRKRALDDLDEGMLARSSHQPVESRLRTWRRYAAAWEVDPWPITWETIHCIGASLKAGHYPSAQNYFDDAFRHQEVHLQSAVPLAPAPGTQGGQIHRQRAARHPAPG